MSESLKGVVAALEAEAYKLCDCHLVGRDARAHAVNCRARGVSEAIAALRSLPTDEALRADMSSAMCVARNEWREVDGDIDDAMADAALAVIARALGIKTETPPATPSPACSSCNGSGADPSEQDYMACRRCGGKGRPAP